MERDLARVDLWEESLRRSRERRERAAAQPPFELPARGLALTGLVALAGVPATAVAAGKVLGDDDAGSAGGAGTEQAAQAMPAEHAAPTPAATGAPAERRATARAATAVAERPAPARPARAKPRSRALTAKAAPAKRPAPVRAATATSTGSVRVRAARSPGVDTRPAVARVARRGGGVVQLQRKLGVPADGVFGPRTERALKRWQRRHGLVADGIAGPATRRAMGLGHGPVLKRKRPGGRRRGGHGRRVRHSRPARGGGVRALQRVLGVSADGVFGPATERALKRWQRAHGLMADGIAGPQTRAKMGLGSGPVLKRKGSGRRHSSGGGESSALQGVIAAANRIATKPYKYGGGHGSFTDTGYDCSGSVSYALHGGGLLSSPLDSGDFMSYGAPGHGRHITIYANPNHVFMTIDGRRFDTSARFETGSRWTSTPRGTSGYVVRHPRGF